MKSPVQRTLRAIRRHPDGIRDFLDDVPDALPYAKGMVRAIREKRIPLHGSPYEVAKRAYQYESGANKFGITMEKIFNEMNKET